MCKSRGYATTPWQLDRSVAKVVSCRIINQTSNERRHIWRRFLCSFFNQELFLLLRGFVSGCQDPQGRYFNYMMRWRGRLVANENMLGKFNWIEMPPSAIWTLGNGIPIDSRKSTGPSGQQYRSRNVDTKESSETQHWNTPIEFKILERKNLFRASKAHRETRSPLNFSSQRIVVIWIKPECPPHHTTFSASRRREKYGDGESFVRRRRPDCQSCNSVHTRSSWENGDDGL